MVNMKKKIKETVSPPMLVRSVADERYLILGIIKPSHKS
jgi:hypothetical protein